MHVTCCARHLRSACLADLPSVGVFWRAVGSYAFVAAPVGHGADTHRLWEILALGSVPVVTAGSLDMLYDHLPVVRVRSWCDLAGFSANASATRARCCVDGSRRLRHATARNRFLLTCAACLLPTIGFQPFASSMQQL